MGGGINGMLRLVGGGTSGKWAYCEVGLVGSGIHRR